MGHTIDKCVALKDEIERLIRASYFKEFIDEPRWRTERSDLDKEAQKRSARC